MQSWIAPGWWVSLTGSDNYTLHLFGQERSGRPVMLAFLVASILLLSLPLVLFSGKEIKRKWLSWFYIAIVAGAITWSGHIPTGILVIALSLIAVQEYSHMLKLSKVDRLALSAFSILLPTLTLIRPNLLTLLPLLLLLVSLVPLLDSDLEHGGERSAYLAFGIIWLSWAPSNLVLIYSISFLVFFAVGITDVFSFLGGKILGRLPLMSYKFSSISPNKRIGGVVGGFIGAWLILWLTGSFSFGLWLAISVGAPLGDLVESMFKRQSGVKDAGTWLPGFGGILDRIDSLLLVIPLVAILAI